MSKGEFVRMIEPYLATIKEVYFSWPGMASGRDMHTQHSDDECQEQLLQDLTWVKSKEMALDLLFNGNCYGNDAFSEKLRKKVYEVIEILKTNNLFPDIVTTTSQFIAKIIKKKYPEIDIRASVNMRIESTRAMDFVSDLFDSFYICRDIQRDLNVLKQFAEWAETHNKTMCMLVNSACLRCCPVQTFHDNLLCHNSWHAHEQEFILHFPFRLCERHFQDPNNLVDILRMSWIRPEDIRYYEPLVSVFKLATRVVPNPRVMIQAYAEGHYAGNLLDILGLPPYGYFDNSAFPDDWISSGIAQSCAINCNNCGKCDEIMAQVFDKSRSPQYTINENQFYI